MLDGNTDDEKPGIEEMYTTAVNTSNLRVEAEKRGDGDVIIAAGWNQARIGGALLRLHTEFDGAEKVRQATAADFLAPGKHSKDERKAASRRAHAFNMHEAGLLLQKLKSWPDVRTQVTLQMVRWKVEDAEAKGVEVLRWWLAQACPVCNGTKMQTAQDTNRHNGKICHDCAGTGIREIPGMVDGWHQAGRRLATWLDQCVARNRASLGRPLRGGEPAFEFRRDMAIERCRAILSTNPNDSAAQKTLDRLTGKPEK